MRLDSYTTGSYTPGAPLWKQMAWFFLGYPLVETRWLPISLLKVVVLRFFGAKVGKGVRIKTGVKVKFPWRLEIGDYAWIGEDVWLDTVAEIYIESHVCLSQGVYLCTGNHDWTDPDFGLKPAPIWLKQGSWIAARATVAPGVTVGEGAILALGSTATQSLAPMTIYAGNPAQPIKPRRMQGDDLSQKH